MVVHFLEYFLQKLGSQNLASMFTNVIDDAMKEHITIQVFSHQSQFRVVIAVVAFGMGIICLDVSQDIYFRSP